MYVYSDRHSVFDNENFEYTKIYPIVIIIGILLALE